MFESLHFMLKVFVICIVGAMDAPVSGVTVKQTDVPTQKSTRGVPKVPSSNTATTGSYTTVPTTPAKGKTHLVLNIYTHTSNLWFVLFPLVIENFGSPFHVQFTSKVLGVVFTFIFDF